MVGLILLGIVLAATGLGLVGAFGLLSFVGIPLLAVGLGLISVGVDPDGKAKLREGAAARAARR